MTGRRQPRLPIGPLEAWLNAHHQNTDPSADTQLHGRLSASRIAELIGFDQSATGRAVVQRWRTAGIPLYAADRAAIRAGAHPTEIWAEFPAIQT